MNNNKDNMEQRALQEYPIIACIFTNFDGFHFSWEKCHPNDNGSCCVRKRYNNMSLFLVWNVLWLILLRRIIVVLLGLHSCRSFLHFGKIRVGSYLCSQRTFPHT